jgi:hypothetical protein
MISGIRTIPSFAEVVQSLKKLLAFILLAAAGFAYYRLVYLPGHQPPVEFAYVLPASLAVMDTTAEVQNQVASLHAGNRIGVLQYTTNWAEVRLADGRSGWVTRKDLLDAATYNKGEQMLESLEDFPAQAVGHTSDVVNLHLEPARDSVQLAALPSNQRLEVFGRKLVERSAPADQPPSRTPVRDAWYLVRADKRAGWLLGRLIDLDVPPALSVYAEGFNTVAWLTLRTVADGNRQVPEYFVADRVGTQDFDFTHIRVFTWWAKRHHYVTAYVESGLRGYFPIRSTEMLDTTYYQNRSPYFRLRLVDQDGNKYQKVYGLFDTVVHPLGIVAGWESDAMPVRAVEHRRYHQRSRRGRKH